MLTSPWSRRPATTAPKGGSTPPRSHGLSASAPWGRTSDTWPGLATTATGWTFTRWAKAWSTLMPLAYTPTKSRRNARPSRPLMGWRGGTARRFPRHWLPASLRTRWLGAIPPLPPPRGRCLRKPKRKQSPASCRSCSHPRPSPPHPTSHSRDRDRLESGCARRSRSSARDRIRRQVPRRRDRDLRLHRDRRASWREDADDGAGRPGVVELGLDNDVEIRILPCRVHLIHRLPIRDGEHALLRRRW